MDPLFFFLLGHIIGDYALQTDAMAANKQRIGGLLIFHAAIYSLTIGASACIHDLFYRPFIFPATLPWLIAIFALHTIQDLIKAKYLSKSRQCYYIDQALHLVALYALRIIVGG
jgi:hypothetical protein